MNPMLDYYRRICDALDWQPDNGEPPPPRVWAWAIPGGLMMLVIGNLLYIVILGGLP